MQVVIVGAGVAGLTLASKLSKEGINTVVIEKEADVGGLARSFSYPNGATYDVGPHRFYTDDQEVKAFIKEALADNLTIIDRNSKLFLFNKYLSWPITLSDVLSLPPHMLLSASIDLLLPRKAKNDSFEDYIIEKYGHTLYKVFFKPFTEKFLDYHCADLHRDWASTGINRATIDKQLNTSSLFNLIKSVLFKGGVKIKFLYPETGGIAAFCKRLADGITSMNGRVALSSEITKFTANGGNISAVVTNRGEEIKADYLFWSGSLRSLHEVGRAPSSIPRMDYLSTLLFNYLTSDHIPQGFQWCYFGDAKAEIDRVSVPRNFSPKTVPVGKEALCVEISCMEGSKTWDNPDHMDSAAERFLLQSKLLKSLDRIEDCRVERVCNTYPMYTLDYPRKLQSIFQWADKNWANLSLIGRTGRFWYNNMDHSISASLKTASRFIKDYRNGELKSGNFYSIEDRGLGESA